MSENIREYLAYFSGNPHLQAIVIVLVSLLAAKLTDLFVSRALRSLTSRTRSDLDDRILAILHRPLFATVALLGLSIALQIELSEELEAYSGPIMTTLIVLVWTTFALKLSTLILTRLSRDTARLALVQPATLPLFDIGTKLVWIALGAYFILLAWNINIGAWLASAGILGLALGLAAQETLANLFAGVSILADAPYKIGDYIILANKERGKVTKIGLRSTRILTRDEIEITVPNSEIAKSTIVNESGGPGVIRRLRVPVGVAYGSDAEEVERILLQIAEQDDLVCKHPAANVRFLNFGSSSLDFELRCWIPEPELKTAVQSRLNHKIYKALDEAGMEIPFPQQDVHLKNVPPALLELLEKLISNPKTRSGSNH